MAIGPRGLGRGAAALTAVVASGALGLQLDLTVARMTGEGAGAAAAVWRFLGFFTVLTNLGVAIVAAVMALAPASRLVGPRVRLATAASIAFVGIVYSVALRSTWAPTGWQAVADHALHDATPVLFLVAWALAADGALKWPDVFTAALPPLAYCLYALARGAADGWYAYWFLDPGRLGLGSLLPNIAVLLAAFLALALVLVAVDRWLGRRPARAG